VIARLGILYVIVGVDVVLDGMLGPDFLIFCVCTWVHVFY
jgi:hypothetical protein